MTVQTSYMCELPSKDFSSKSTGHICILGFLRCRKEAKCLSPFLFPFAPDTWLELQGCLWLESASLQLLNTW